MCLVEKCFHGSGMGCRPWRQPIPPGEESASWSWSCLGHTTSDLPQRTALKKRYTENEPIGEVGTGSFVMRHWKASFLWRKMNYIYTSVSCLLKMSTACTHRTSFSKIPPVHMYLKWQSMDIYTKCFTRYSKDQDSCHWVRLEHRAIKQEWARGAPQGESPCLAEEVKKACSNDEDINEHGRKNQWL